MTQGENVNPYPREQKRKEGKFPNQRVGESKKRKEKFPMKEWEKAKKRNKVPDQRSKENRRNMQKGLLDQTTFEHVQSYYQVNKKKGETTT